mgnify:CR=1 FL=1
MKIIFGGVVSLFLITGMTGCSSSVKNDRI